MQRRQLGNSGLTVSRMALGTMTWGGRTDEHEARDQLTTFVDAGGTLLDTAASYTRGQAEEIIGTLLGSAVAREEVTLATKAGIVRAGGERRVNTSRGTLLDTLDASLKRLQVDHVDLWQVHVWSDATPIEETLGALEDAVRSGRTRYVGVSNYNGWQTARAATNQNLLRQAPLVSNQVEYSLLCRGIEAEAVPAALAHRVGILPWAPLGRGVLTGKYRASTPADSRAADDDFMSYVGPYLTEPHSRVVEAVARAAAGLDWTPLQVALVWVRDAPGVVSPILGSRTTKQLRAALGIEGLELPDELRTALNDVSRGLSQ
jgi:aryl-alcohol dehydrogenase-like predicted oxidoreductase